MNKITRIILLITIVMFPIIVNAKESVSITKIVEVEKKGQTVVKAEPTFEGLTINYNLSFIKEKDSIKYKATLKNDDKEDYKITNKTEFSKSGYIRYTFEFSDNSNTIKPNETKDMFITIEYYKEVPDEKLVNGQYTEENEMNIILVNNEGQVPNPNTSSSIIMLIIILSLLLVSIYLFNNHKRLSMLLLIIALSIPITTYALKEIKVTLNTKIEIKKELEFCNYSFISDGTNYYPIKNYYKFIKGMTWRDWINSSYFDETARIGVFEKQEMVSCTDEAMSHYDFDNMTDEDWTNYYNEYYACYRDEYIIEYHPIDAIKDKSEGCYNWPTE